MASENFMASERDISPVSPTRLRSDLAVPPLVMLPEGGDDDYAVERWIIENVKKIGDLNSRITTLRALIDSKRNNISEREKQNIIGRAKDILISQNRDITADNVGEIITSLRNGRTELLGGAVNRLTPLAHELIELESLSHGFSDIEALETIRERIEHTEKTLRRLGEEIMDC